MTATIRAFLLVLGLEALAGTLWFLYWVAVAAGVVPSPPDYDASDLTWPDVGALMTLFTGLPALLGAVLASVVARGTARRARWAPEVSSGAHALALFLLLVLQNLPTSAELLRWSAVTLAVVALVIPVLPAGRSWFRGRVAA